MKILLITMKYMIIDDNVKIREIIREVVSKETDTIMEFNSGEEAFEALNYFMPDYILIDIHIKGTNGLEITKKILDKYPDIKVIIVSDYDMPSFHSVAKKFGAVKFISKDNLLLLRENIFIT